jgi:hypothetical protein
MSKRRAEAGRKGPPTLNEQVYNLYCAALDECKLRGLNIVPTRGGIQDAFLNLVDKYPVSLIKMAAKLLSKVSVSDSDMQVARDLRRQNPDNPEVADRWLKERMKESLQNTSVQLPWDTDLESDQALVTGQTDKVKRSKKKRKRRPE